MRYAAIALVLCACGGGAPDAADAGDAGGDVHYGHKPIDASTRLDAADDEAAAKTPWDRMSDHGGEILASMRLHALYVAAASDVPKNRDDLLQWIVSSPDYWSVLAQYGVGYGDLSGSTTIDAATFFQDGDVQGGLVAAGRLAGRISEAVAALPPDEAGVPNAYVVFLPSDVNVDLGIGKTCTWALGYHDSFDTMPYAVIPWCGDSGTTVSHELAEMATDPFYFQGWFSDTDELPAGGEVGDLCNFPTEIDGRWVTELWSNADGDCEPK